jgi:hypothetical protein
MTKPTDPPPSVDREVPTPRASGSFLIFHTRAQILHSQLVLVTTRTPFLDALRSKVDALVVECERWPDIAPTDVTERLAATNEMFQKIRDLEEQVKTFLEGGR